MRKSQQVQTAAVVATAVFFASKIPNANPQIAALSERVAAKNFTRFLGRKIGF